MPRPPSTEPTEVELQILRILWDREQATAREIHDGLQAHKTTNYSTTVKMLGVARDKGLVVRDEDARPHVYRAAESRAHTQRSMLRRLVRHAFDGSTKSLVLHALGDRTRPEDLDEIRRVLERMEEGEER